MQPQKFIKEKDNRHIVDSLIEFRAPKDDKRVVHLCKPFVVLSKNTYSAPVTLPLGLAYIGGVLEKAGYKTRILDAIGDTKPVLIKRNVHNLYSVQGLDAQEIIERIDMNAKIFALSLMFTQEWILHRELIKKVRKARPDLIIVVGGEHPSAISEYVLRDCSAIDYVVRGEGELSLLELVYSIYNKKDPTKIEGVCFIDNKNNFVDNGLSKRIEYIDEIPKPAWHLLNVENYFNDYFTSGLARGRNMAILATRGCPYQCTFCFSPSMWTTRYVMRDPKDLVDEMEWLISEYRANSFEFYDLTAIIKKEWTLEFCDEMKKRNLIDITWQLPVGTRTEVLDEETLQAIYDTGCRFITYAPESGTDNTLKMIKKKVKLDRLTLSMKNAVKIGHTIRLNFIIGFPHETFFDCLRTVLFAYYCAFRYGVSDINFAIFAPYPGSELFKQLEEQKKIKINDQYIENLLIQFDLTKSFSYCNHVSGIKLMILRILGFSGSYIIIYLSRPKKIFNLIMNILKNKFVANSLIEQRVYDMIVRRKLKSK